MPDTINDPAPSPPPPAGAPGTGETDGCNITAAQLAGVVQSLNAELKAKDRALVALREELRGWEEREASVCHEDVGFVEYIGALTRRAEAAEADMNALANEALPDAERLDWWEANPNAVSWATGRLGARGQWSASVRGEVTLHPTLRAAIDAARAAGEGSR